MRRLTRFLILAAASLAVAAAQEKVGVISSQGAVIGTAEFKKWRTDAEAKFKPRQDALIKLQKELSDIQAQLQSGKLSQQGELQLQDEMKRKQREGQRMQQDYQEDLDRDQNEELQKIGTRMRDLVTKMAVDKGYDIVVDAGNAVYFKPAFDLTQEAIATFDKTYPVK
jgi:outer membrane protein